MKTNELISLMHAIAARIEKEKDYLTELDNVIGDGDHGINMARGFKATETRIDGLTTPAEVLKTVGMTLVSTVGGAAGPLYGTAFMKMAQTLAGKDEITVNDLAFTLSAFSYCNLVVTHSTSENTIDAMRALYEFYKATVAYNTPAEE